MTRDYNLTVIATVTFKDLSVVNAFAFNQEKGTLKLLNSQKTGGEDPCYIITNGNNVITANYSVADSFVGRRILVTLFDLLHHSVTDASFRVLRLCRVAEGTENKYFPVGGLYL